MSIQIDSKSNTVKLSFRVFRLITLFLRPVYHLNAMRVKMHSIRFGKNKNVYCNIIGLQNVRQL